MTSVLAMNMTEKTSKLLSKVLSSKTFSDFSHNTDLNLDKNSIFLRLAIINLIKNPPSERDVESYKIALLNLQGFDSFMKNYLKWDAAS